jgi:hypothetical protein
VNKTREDTVRMIVKRAFIVLAVAAVVLLTGCKPDPEGYGEANVDQVGTVADTLSNSGHQ